MQTDNEDNMQGMPTDFEILEVRRALHKGRVADPDADKAWERFRQTLVGLPMAQGNDLDAEESNATSGSNNSLPVDSVTETSEHRLWYSRQRVLSLLRIVGAVAAVALLAVVLYPLLHHTEDNGIEVYSATTGTQDITLTADDGTPQVVKGKSLAFNRPIQRTERIRMMNVSNPRGKVCRVVLPDGTAVWLNADSHLSFPERFTGRTRDVSLSGEAYFEVQKDVRHPFVVTTESMTTTVHGTVFDVCAYSSRDTRVTLFEGSVAVKGTQGDEQFIRPGQVAVANADGTVACTGCDTYPVAQWKDGFFYFSDNRLIDIMRELGRWYNVNVVFESEQAMNLRLHFVAEHTESLAAIISRMNELGVAHVSLKDDVVSVR